MEALIVGYSQKSSTGSLVNFIQSITDSQWLIALEKVLRGDQRLVLTVKLVELDNTHPLLRVKPVDVSTGKKQCTTKSKREGKGKRKENELREDNILWNRLKNKEAVTRNARQTERLCQWKVMVAQEYEGCEAIDESVINKWSWPK